MEFWGENINDKNYSVMNRVLVPMGSIVGDRIMICYDRNCPSRVFNYSLKRALLLLIVATVSWGAAVMLRNTF